MSSTPLCFTLWLCQWKRSLLPWGVGAGWWAWALGSKRWGGWGGGWGRGVEPQSPGLSHLHSHSRRERWARSSLGLLPPGGGQTARWHLLPASLPVSLLFTPLCPSHAQTQAESLTPPRHVTCCPPFHLGMASFLPLPCSSLMVMHASPVL